MARNQGGEGLRRSDKRSQPKQGSQASQKKRFQKLKKAGAKGGGGRSETVTLDKERAKGGRVTGRRGGKTQLAGDKGNQRIDQKKAPQRMDRKKVTGKTGEGGRSIGDTETKRKRNITEQRKGERRKGGDGSSPNTQGDRRGPRNRRGETAREAKARRNVPSRKDRKPRDRGKGFKQFGPRAERRKLRRAERKTANRKTQNQARLKSENQARNKKKKVAASAGKGIKRALGGQKTTTRRDHRERRRGPD